MPIRIREGIVVHYIDFSKEVYTINMRWPRVFTPNNLNYQGIAIGWSSKLFNIEKSVYI